MVKYVYVVRQGQLNPAKEQFEFYGMEIHSSRKKAEAYVKWILDVNKGYKIEEPYHYAAGIPEEDKSWRDKLLNYQVDYCWRGEGPDGQVEVKSRIVVEQMELK